MGGGGGVKLEGGEWVQVGGGRRGWGKSLKRWNVNARRFEVGWRCSSCKKNSR